MSEFPFIDALDSSVSHLSSEIDEILHGINAGLILASPKQSHFPDSTGQVEADIPTLAIETSPPPNDCSVGQVCNSIAGNMRETSDKSANAIRRQEREKAAMAIQRWFRKVHEMRQKRKVLQLQELLQNKKDTLSCSKNMEQLNQVITGIHF